MRTLAALLLALAAGPAAAEPVSYRLDPSHSFVHFEWPHAGLSTLHGRFDKTAGRVTLDREAGTGGGRIEVRLDSVNTGRPALDAALRQALGAGLAVFDIDTLRVDGGRVLAAQGPLRWAGRQHTLDLQAQRFNCYTSPLFRRQVCGGEFSTTLDPAALGLDLRAAFGLGAPLVLRVQVEGVRMEAGDEDGS